MSSRLTIILLSLILLPGCGNDRSIDDRTAMGINGDVRQMTVVREDLANGLPPMLDDWQSEVWFDSAGQLSAVNGFEFSAHGDSITVTPSDSRTGIVIKLRRWQDGTALHYDGTVTDLSFPGGETSQCSASITLDDMGRVAAGQPWQLDHAHGHRCHDRQARLHRETATGLPMTVRRRKHEKHYICRHNNIATLHLYA